MGNVINCQDSNDINKGVTIDDQPMENTSNTKHNTSDNHNKDRDNSDKTNSFKEIQSKLRPSFDLKLQITVISSDYLHKNDTIILNKLGIENINTWKKQKTANELENQNKNDGFTYFGTYKSSDFDRVDIIYEVHEKIGEVNGQHFVIFYHESFDEYFIRDFTIGPGVFEKITNRETIKNDSLYLFGQVYILIGVETDQHENCWQNQADLSKFNSQLNSFSDLESMEHSFLENTSNSKIKATNTIPKKTLSNEHIPEDKTTKFEKKFDNKGQDYLSNGNIKIKVLKDNSSNREDFSQ